MSVSDGLLAELRNLMEDSTPRGPLWDLVAIITCQFASLPWTESQAQAFTEGVIVLIDAAEAHAFEQIEFQCNVDYLSDWLEKNRGESDEEVL